jgi:hypothetical protein
MKLHTRLLIAALLLCSIAVPAMAQITFTQRNTLNIFSLPNTSTFDGASIHYANTIHLSAQQIGDNRDDVWDVMPVAENFNWQTNGDQIGVSYGLTGPYQYTGTYTATNGLRDTATIDYIVPLGSDLAQSFITAGISDGHYVLNFSGGGRGSVDLGYQYIYSILLPGNWSVQGTQQGNHNFIALSPNWTIGKNWMYDSQSNRTSFLAAEGYYQGDDPGLRFQLIGAPVATPEPSSLLLLGSGIVGIAGGGLRRRFMR